MGAWITKFLINRFLYMLLLIILCFGIFPFIVLFTLTMWMAGIWDKFSPKSKIAPKIERVWDVIGIPYDALVKLVG